MPRPLPLLLALPLLLVLAACAGNGAGAGTCDVGTLDPGTIEATVDGEAWTGGATTWLLAGSSLQVNSESAGGWWLSAVAQETTAGAALGDAVSAGSWPADVDLPPDGGTGGWVTFYPDSGDSYSTKQADGGSLTLAGEDGTDLLGCFSFTAANGAGDEVTVESGVFRATGG